MKRNINRFLKLSGLSLVVLASQAYASGYRIEMQSSSVLADSGEAAVVEDAGTNWYNAAGLPYLPQQFVGSAIDVYAPTSFSGTVFAPSPFPFPIGSNFSANGSASSHPNVVLPALHYTYPFNSHWAAGISIVPAWGLLEDYGRSSILRYDLIKVTTKSIDVSPSVAYKYDDHWSFGVGPDFNYFSVDSSARARTQLLTTADSESRYNADDWAYGGHAGLLYRFNDTTRLGLNYRSKLVMRLEGDSDFTLGDPIGTAFTTNQFKLRIVLPPTTTLSLYHDVTPCWALMGTIAYDQWSVLSAYHANNYQALGIIIPDVVVTQNMRDTIDLGIGTHYKFNDQWMLRANVKYLPTPTRDAYRDVNFPDGDKLGFQIGARYQMNPKLALDMLYGHVFIRTVPINLVQPVTAVAVDGHNRTSIDLFGAQVVWDI